MKHYFNAIKVFLFGEKTLGEKLQEPSPIKERPFDSKAFYDWCNELRVSSLYDRQIIHL